MNELTQMAICVVFVAVVPFLALLVRRFWIRIHGGRIVFLRQRVLASRKVIASFVAKNSPQSDDDFLTGCAVGEISTDRDRALAIRRVIARFGKVPAEFIHFNNTFFDLEVLPRLGQRIGVYFDDDLFYRMLGRALNKDLTSRDIESMPSPEYCGDKMTVGEFVQKWVEFCKRDRRESHSMR